MMRSPEILDTADARTVFTGSVAPIPHSPSLDDAPPANWTPSLARRRPVGIWPTGFEPLRSPTNPTGTNVPNPWRVPFPGNAGTVETPTAKERFSSSDLAGLKYVDGFGELPGLPGAAAEFAQDAPGFELGRWRVRRGRAAGRETRLAAFCAVSFPCPCTGTDARADPGVALVRQHQQATGGSSRTRALDPGGGQVVRGAGERTRYPQNLSGAAKREAGADPGSASRPVDAVKPGDLLILPALRPPHRHHDSMCSGRPAESQARQRNGQPRRRRHAAADKGRTDEG